MVHSSATPATDANCMHFERQCRMQLSMEGRKKVLVALVWRGSQLIAIPCTKTYLLAQLITDFWEAEHMGFWDEILGHASGCGLALKSKILANGVHDRA